MAEEKAKEFLEKNDGEDAAAYSANFGAHRVGITRTEAADYYSKWALSGNYEKDLALGRYNGPIYAAETLAEFFPTARETVKVLDVAAGTGYVGEQLKDRGFANMDALDPAQGMLDAARKKGIYTDFICSFLDQNRLPIKDDTYDCSVISGGMGEGHIPCVGLHELVRITKPGGLVVVVMREEYLQDVGEYKDKLEPLMEQLEKDGKWKRMARRVRPNYSFNKNGVVYVFQIC